SSFRFLAADFWALLGLGVRRSSFRITIGGEARWFAVVFVEQGGRGAQVFVSVQDFFVGAEEVRILRAFFGQGVNRRRSRQGVDGYRAAQAVILAGLMNEIDGLGIGSAHVGQGVQHVGQSERALLRSRGVLRR